MMESYAITSNDGHTFFVEADCARVDRQGRLLFRRWYGRVVSGVDAGQWSRFVRGLTFEDMQKAERERRANDRIGTASV